MANHQRYSRQITTTKDVRYGSVPALLRALATEIERASDAMLASLTIGPVGNVATTANLDTDRVAWNVRLTTELGIRRWPEGKTGSCPTCDGCGGFTPDGTAHTEWSDVDGVRCVTCGGSGYLAAESDSSGVG